MRKLQLLFSTLAVLLISTPAFAQAAGTAAPASYWWVSIGAALGMGIAAGLCGIGQGNATASATLAVARNPGARPAIFLFLILGLALIESLALFTFVVIILKVK
jgi:F-type H+-transporting ATPase subunit c